MKMNKMIRGLLTLNLVGLMLISGCALVSKVFSFATVSPPDSPALRDIQFDDIPVPHNFRHLPDETAVLIDTNIRTGQMKYVATSFVHTNDVIKFYEKHMPLHGWQKVFEKDAGWNRELTFKKDHEECKVIVNKTPAKMCLVIKIGTK